MLNFIIAWVLITLDAPWYVIAACFIGSVEIVIAWASIISFARKWKDV